MRSFSGKTVGTYVWSHRQPAHFAIWLFSWFVAACGGTEPTKEPNQSPLAAAPSPLPNSRVKVKTTLTCPHGTLLTYENFGEAFMLNYCTSCHARALSGSERIGAPANINLDKLEDMALWRNAINASVLGATPTMPPSDNISDADKSQLAEWIGCGAPGEG